MGHSLLKDSTLTPRKTKPKGLWEEGQWPADLAVQDSDVVALAKNDMIESFRIIELQKHHFYVTLELKGGFGGRIRHLATHRVRTEPRLFKNLARLVEHIRDHYETIREIALTIDRRKTQADKTKTKEAASPQRRATDRVQ